MDQVKFVEDSLSKIWSDMVGGNFLKDCLSQILFGPFLNKYFALNTSALSYYIWFRGFLELIH